MFSEQLDAIKVYIDHINKYVVQYCSNIIDIINKNYPNMHFMTPYLTCLNNNPAIVVVLLVVLFYMCSDLLIKFMFVFFMINSVILSLLLLDDILVDEHYKFLAKNVIIMFILYFNFIGSLFTLILVFCFMKDASILFNSILINTLTNIICFISHNIPIVKNMYPKIVLINSK